jgi:hypothetical protein
MLSGAVDTSLANNGVLKSTVVRRAATASRERIDLRIRFISVILGELWGGVDHTWTCFFDRETD